MESQSGLTNFAHVQKQQIIGLTGGIGGGKSTVARMARICGIPVYDADEEAKKLYTKHRALREAVGEVFGTDVFMHDQVNRTLLASRIFESVDGKEKIGVLIQPYLQRDFAAWCHHHSGHTWLMKEAAILIESGNYRECAHIIQVVAPEPLRIARVQMRNGWTEADIRLRIAAQLSDNDRAAHCDFTIVNDDVQAVFPQLLSALHAIMD